LQLDTLTPEFLGALGIAPHGRIRQLALDLNQALGLGIEVKDTP
jgi:hypothetical protein